MAARLDDIRHAPIEHYFVARLAEEQDLASKSTGAQRDMHLRACAIIRQLIASGLKR